MTNQLLGAPLIKGTVTRQRLLDRLHSGLGYCFQVINAPTGYGKTTLLAEFARELEAPVYWYTLSAPDSDPVDLYHGLISSFHAGTGSNPEIPFTANPGSTGADLSAALIKHLTQLADYFVLIIEDMHLAAGTASSELIDLLADNWPENGHLLLTSRSIDGFNRIKDSLIRQQAGCIGTSDLGFTVAEIKQLAHNLLGKNIADDRASQLAQQMDGWPLGISLALNSSGELSEISDAGNNQLFDFLSRQVLDQQTAETRKLLFSLSAFPVIQPEICGDILGIKDIRNKLHHLHQANLFLSMYSRDEFRFHQLFREFLQTSFKESDPSAFSGLHSRAAEKLESLGHIEQALEHYLTAGNFEAVTRVILASGEELFRRGRCTGLAHWLSRLPEKLRYSKTELEILYARCLVNIGEPGKAGRIITSILLDNARHMDNITRARALYGRSSACRLLGQHSQSLLDAETALWILEGNAAEPGLLGDIYTRIGHIYFDKAEYSHALVYLQKAKNLYAKIFDLDSLACVNNTLGGVYKNLGNLSQASVYYEYARQGFEKNGNQGNLAMVLTNIAYIQHKHGLQQLVIQSLEQACKHACDAGYRRIQTIIHLAYGEVYRDLGDYEKSLDAFEQALEFARASQETRMVCYAKAGLGETCRLAGDLTRAEFWTLEALAQANVEQQSYETALFEMQMAMIDDTSGKNEQASLKLKEVYKKMLPIGDPDALARICFAAAAADFNQKKYEAAGNWLKTMLGHVEALGYDDFVVIEGSRNPLLIQHAASKTIGGRYFVTLIERIKHKNEQISSAQLPASRSPGLTQIESYAFSETCVILNRRQVDENSWRSNRAKELFFFLLTNPGKSAEEIFTELWPDLPPAKSASNFHINLFRARRATSPSLIIQKNGRYYIHPETSFWYDVNEFEKLGKQISFVPADAKLYEAEKLVALYRGIFMPGFENQWVVRKRCELENKYLKLLFEMVGYFAKKGDMARVAAVVERVLDVNSDDDEVYYQGIQAYLALGEHLSATHLYRRYLSNVKELGVEPEPKILHLAGQLSFN